MDFEQNSGLSGAAATQGPGGPQSPPPGQFGGIGAGRPQVQDRRRGRGWRILWGIVSVLSILANIALLLILLGMVAVFATGQRGILTEEVVRHGDRLTKIAMVTVEGIIAGDLAEDVYRQLRAARQDRRVKAVIVKVSSPGGTISGSDQIYQEIKRFRQERKDKPVVAFMQGMAASGGYYASVACEKIVAEPTTITGSIGVIGSYFVFQELLESKLGILPVIVKSGEKKDWPSSFRAPTEEQLRYMQDKLITPAFERFVEIVAEGRAGSLTLDDVRRLADGGIFGAREAVQEKLIDSVGYLDDAIELVKSMAGIADAQVVQYRKPFSLIDLLGYRKDNILTKINKTTLYELGSPEVMYLWSAY